MWLGRPVALTGGFQAAFLVLGSIALMAPPAIFALIRRTGTRERKSAMLVNEEPMAA